MKKTIFIFIATLLAFSQGFVNAAELAFPKTEQDIVRALSLKDGRTVFEGVDYISENGRIYKIIGGKRYRLRGLYGIVDSDIVPKAGALINFDLNSAEIRDESYPLLDEFGRALKNGLANGTFYITGHTDSSGTQAYNQNLSVRRANSVADYLMTHHRIAPARLVPKGYGELKPIASNDNENGRSLNRRVEFVRVE